MNRNPAAKPGAGDALLRTGAAGLREDLLSARHELFAGRHAVYQRLAGVLATLLAEGELCGSFERAWRSREFPTMYERPLLLMAALRVDALDEGPAHPLHGALAVDGACRPC
jgi:hypothetical protein